MNPTTRSAGVTAALAVTVTMGCIFPTERSGELTVVLDSIPALFLKDQIQLSAELLGPGGVPIENGTVSFSSSDLTVVSVDADGMLLAVGAGTATITARAPLQENTDPDQQVVTVRGLLEIDSIVPAIINFGDVVTLYGVGLSPESLFSVTIGGVDVPDLADFASYTPADPAFPNRLGALSVFVSPPADALAGITVLGFNGGLVHTDSVRVLQFDVYEPNDTAPWALGNLGAGLANPALAFESRKRNDDRPAADWYTFTNAQQQTRTIFVFGEGIGAETFSVFVTDSLFWDGFSLDYLVGTQAWLIGPSLFLCDGMGITEFGSEFQPFEEDFPFAILALKDLPTGDYHIIAPYTAPAEPQAYRLIIANGYFSFEPADAAEENDYCDVAANLVGLGATELTVDNPHDSDWFKFTVPAAGQTFKIVATSPDSLLDIDLYLIADFRPDSLPVIELSVQDATPDSMDVVLPAGDYFLLVVDFAGETGPYNLAATFTPAPAGVAQQFLAARSPVVRAAMDAKRRAIAASDRKVRRPRPARRR